MCIYLQSGKYSYPPVFYTLCIIDVGICFLLKLPSGLIFLVFTDLAIFDSSSESGIVYKDGEDIVVVSTSRSTANC